MIFVNSPMVHIRKRLTQSVLGFYFQAILALSPFYAFADTGTLDSLSQALKNADTDSARIFLHVKLSNHLLATDYKEALAHASSAVELAEKNGKPSWMITAYKAAGNTCMQMGLNDLSVRYFNLQYDKAGEWSEMGGRRWKIIFRNSCF